MKILKLLSMYIGLSFFLNSCSSLGEAGKILRNEKVTSSDEFLIKKKEPLTQPPEFDVIPQPGSVVNNKLSKKTGAILVFWSNFCLYSTNLFLVELLKNSF